MILITKPRVTSGGVYTFVENITPFLGADTVVFLRGNKVGNANKLLRLFYSIVNPFVFIKTLILRNPDEVIINTSLSFSCLLRDGVLVFISKLFQKKVLLIIHGFQEAALGHWALLKAGYFRADAITVLANEFSKFAYQDRCMTCTYCVCKENFGFIRFNLCFKFLNFLVS